MNYLNQRRQDDASILWEAFSLCGVDGVPFHTYTNPGTAAGWPFNNPQYMLLNLAIGGDMTGAVDDAIFDNPVKLEIEHVRIFQRD